MTEFVHPSGYFVVPKLPRVEVLTDLFTKRLVVIGDVHGCLDELVQLLNKVDIQDDDLLVFAGDLVDRGPESGACADLVKDLCRNRMRTFCVLGNHEEKHVRFRHHLKKMEEKPGYKNPMKPLRAYAQQAHEELSDDTLHWMSLLPGVVVLDCAFVTGNMRFITHAGFLPSRGQPASQPTKGLIRNRYIKPSVGEDGVTRWSPVKFTDNFEKPEGSFLWDELWTRPERVIYGHIVHDLKTPRVYNNCYGIDTGCAFGGHLTAYVENLRTGETSFVQVAANRVYFEMKDIE